MRALVIGGTSGIGYGIARSLAKEGISVTISGRSQERGEEIVRELKTLTTKEDAHFEFVPCNSFLIKNIKKMSEEYSSKYDKLDILVLTQGMATIQGLTETSEGIDEKLALHYYGRFAYITFLLPLLRNSSSSPKVLSVLSGGVHSPYADYATDPMLKKNYSIPNAANAAGFYNDLALDSFSHQEGNEKIAFIHSAPGFVSTNWGTEMPFWLRYPIRLLQYFGRSIDDSGYMLTRPLLDQESSGLKILNYSSSTAGVESPVTKLHSPEAVEFMWKHTNEVIKSIVEDSK